MAGHEAGQEAVGAVGQQAALDAGVRVRALDGQAAHVAGGLLRAREATRDPRLLSQAVFQRGLLPFAARPGGVISDRVGPCRAVCMRAGLDVAHRLHGRDHEAQQQRDEGGRVEADVEGGRPASCRNASRHITPSSLPLIISGTTCWGACDSPAAILDSRGNWNAQWYRIANSAGGPEEGEDAGLVDLVTVHVGQGRAVLGRVGGHSRHEEAEEERQGDGAVLHEGRAHRLNEDLRVRLGSRGSRDVGCSMLYTSIHATSAVRLCETRRAAKPPRRSSRSCRGQSSAHHRRAAPRRRCRCRSASARHERAERAREREREREGERARV